MTQERQGSKPNIMAFEAGGGEFERPLGRQDEDGTIELVLQVGALGQGVVILDVEHGLNYHCSLR